MKRHNGKVMEVRVVEIESEYKNTRIKTGEKPETDYIRRLKEEIGGRAGQTERSGRAESSISQ